MSAFSLSDLEASFDKIGCRYKSVSGNRMYTGLRCRMPFYRLGLPVQILVQEHWVTVRGIVQNTIPPKQVPTVLTSLAELNAQFRMVRCTTVGGAVIMQADLMRSRCELENVLEMITAIVRYAASSILELSVLINNEFIAASYMRLQQEKRTAKGSSAFDPDQAFDFDIAANLLTR